MNFFFLCSEKLKRFDSKRKLQNKIENSWNRNGNMQWDGMSFHPDEVENPKGESLTLTVMY